MTRRTNKSKMFRTASCALSVCLLLAAPGCALLQETQQEPIAQEPAIAEKEEVRPEEPKKVSEQKPRKKPAAEEPAPAEPEPQEATVAMQTEPELLDEKTYDLGETDSAALPTGVRTGITLQGEGPYPTSNDLQVAADAALTDGRVLGGIASFDAFPDIPGEDTVGQVFREKSSPGTRIKLFAFHAPGQEFHRVIYGYVVEDTVKDEVTGYFDENLDGVFEKVTLKPVIKPAALFAR